jgi:hypothetical protein
MTADGLQLLQHDEGLVSADSDRQRIPDVLRVFGPPDTIDELGIEPSTLGASGKPGVLTISIAWALYPWGFGCGPPPPPPKTGPPVFGIAPNEVADDNNVFIEGLGFRDQDVSVTLTVKWTPFPGPLSPCRKVVACSVVDGFDPSPFCPSCSNGGPRAEPPDFPVVVDPHAASRSPAR